MKLLMPITSAPIGRNRHMSISHCRDKPFIMAVIARYKRSSHIIHVLVIKLTRGALQYQMDIGVRLTLPKAGDSVRTQSQKMRGHCVRSQILVQNLGALGENVIHLIFQ